MADAPKTERLRLGVSVCLLGEEVRYNGGHKRDRFLLNTLGEFVDWVTVCPEVEIGLGTPREAIHLAVHLPDKNPADLAAAQDSVLDLKHKIEDRYGFYVLVRVVPESPS